MSFIVVKRAKSQVQGANRPLQASMTPHEHMTRDAADTEARRLATVNPSFEFIVFEPVFSVKGEVKLEEAVLR